MFDAGFRYGFLFGLSLHRTIWILKLTGGNLSFSTLKYENPLIPCSMALLFYYVIAVTVYLAAFYLFVFFGVLVEILVGGLETGAYLISSHAG
jgi:hypothetical protein